MPRTSGPVRRTVLVVASVVLAATLTAATTGGGDGLDDGTAGEPVAVRLLALNDFHGNLEPPTGSGGRIVDENGVTVDAGGAAYVATWMKRLENANTLKVAQGDLIGASPLISAAYHDEPTLEFFNNLGITASAVGNHEFDEGAGELLRIQNGGCHAGGCADPEQPYKGAEFQYLSANAFVTDTGEPLLAPYAVKEVAGVRIGFIGMTLEGTPDIVTQSGVAGLEFRDEIETGNRYRPAGKSKLTPSSARTSVWPLP